MGLLLAHYVQDSKETGSENGGVKYVHPLISNFGARTQLSVKSSVQDISTRESLSAATEVTVVLLLRNWIVSGFVNTAVSLYSISCNLYAHDIVA